MNRKLKIGFLVSHRGSSMRAILDAMVKGALNAEAAVVVSNNADSPALSIAEERGIPAYHLSQTKLGLDIDLDQAILSALKDNGANLIILSGYLRKLGSKTLTYYDGRILNIHPSLLPKFGGTGMYGMHVHEAVISAGEKTSGASIHLIDEEYDTGVVIAQHTVDVLPHDTPESLASRIQGVESIFFTNTIRKIISGDIELPNIWS